MHEANIEMVNRENVIDETEKHAIIFLQIETAMYFAENIVAALITLIDAGKDQCDSLIKVVDFNKDSKPRYMGIEMNTKKDACESINAINKGRGMLISIFKSGIFPLAPVKGTKRPSDSAAHLKVSTAKDSNSTCKSKYNYHIWAYTK